MFISFKMRFVTAKVNKDDITESPFKNFHSRDNQFCSKVYDFV